MQATAMEEGPRRKKQIETKRKKRKKKKKTGKKPESVQWTAMEDSLRRPLHHTTRGFYVFLGVLAFVMVWFAFAWTVQARTGLVATGLGDIPGSVPWGILVVNYVYFAGIASTGIAIASAIRLLGLKDFLPLARMAEVMTIASLPVAVLSLISDLGRPGRLLNIVLHYPRRVASSPMVWDVTVLSVYLVFAVAYLLIEMREDLVRLAKDAWPERLYRLLLAAYKPGERQRTRKIIWWASVLNLPLMVIMGTVVGWVFGLGVGRPGWYGAAMAPHSIVTSILSGLAAIVVVAALLRRAFGLQEFIKPTVFKGLGISLAWASIICLYFELAKFVTVRFSGPIPELKVSEVLSGIEFGWFFWIQIAVLVVAFGLNTVNVLFPKLFRIWTTVATAVLLVVALWATCFLVVVPSLTQPYLPYLPGRYRPTWVEWSLVGGAFAVVGLVFALFTKVFPMIPITEMQEAEQAGL